MKKIWKEILAVGVLAFLDSQLESTLEENKRLESERDELQARLDNIDNDDDYNPYPSPDWYEEDVSV